MSIYQKGIKVKLCLWLYLTTILGVASLQGHANIEYLRFVEFPLLKVDYMYREQGGPVAALVFDLWKCTKAYLEKDFEQYRSRPDVLRTVKDGYHKEALPMFKRLNTFKRFIDELSCEWVAKRHREGLRELFSKMFSRKKSKSYIDSLSAEEFNEVLQDLWFFLWDVSQNAPHARKKCLEKLPLEEHQVFEEFVAADYLDFR